VIAAMSGIRAVGALFLDVDHLAVRGHFTVFARHAPAPECREPNQPNQTHHDASPDRAKLVSNIRAYQFDE
jgi:hypothetical protein